MGPAIARRIELLKQRVNDIDRIVFITMHDEDGKPMYLDMADDRICKAIEDAFRDEIERLKRTVEGVGRG